MILTNYFSRQLASFAACSLAVDQNHQSGFVLAEGNSTNAQIARMSSLPTARHTPNALTSDPLPFSLRPLAGSHSTLFVKYGHPAAHRAPGSGPSFGRNQPLGTVGAGLGRARPGPRRGSTQGGG